MATKRTGISRDLIIHPGETIADLLEERGMMQSELAVQTGVTAAYVSNVIAGKKDISSGFALRSPAVSLLMPSYTSIALFPSL